MAKFLMKDLNSVFSSIVADYLRRGYVICLDSMHHYRVDMVMGKGKVEHYISVQFEFVHTSTFDPEPNQFVINVAMFEGAGNEWASKIKDIKTLTFYEIEYQKCYSDSKEEALALKQLGFNRWKSRDYTDELTAPCKKVDPKQIPESVKDSIMEKVRDIRGFKRATFDCVTSIEFYRSSSSHKRMCIVEAQLKDRKTHITFK